MSDNFETRDQAWDRRAALRGEVDFTMMYVGHDAFARDLDRLVHAVESGTLDTDAARSTWTTFHAMLHLHHSAEDAALWPLLRDAVDSDQDLDLLDAMEAEHAGIDPRLAAIETGFATGDHDLVAENLLGLRAELRAHMLHEENEALPLLERTLGAPGWAAFGEAAHEQGGMKGAATMLPWVLDGASAEHTTQLLAMMPASARVMYRRLLRPRYDRAVRLH